MYNQEIIWNSLSIFYSSINAQKYLLHCYQKLGMEDAEKKSYENCYPFIYYLDHGKSYYQLANQAPFSIKPILLFYGMVQLLKACLLTVDPAYPESSTVLAHGVTTRKRKKRNYEFLKDEVKIQKNGLFPQLAIKMFHMKQNLDAEKYTMEFLLARIPELNHIFQTTFDKMQSYKIARLHDMEMHIPMDMLDHLHMTSDRFHTFLKQVLPIDFQIIENKNSEKFQIQLSKPLNVNEVSPLQVNCFEQTIHIPIEKKQFFFFPEMMTHYLLLYNLSMIARYETEWWSELLYSFDSLDYPFIHQFLHVTAIKVPFLINDYLQQKKVAL
ncbi:YaaC family protein [Calidifontibacillus erzurumensis]|uniref:YaaC family protein n=1 Tax=Calidifontibacillus erzurumensis TaxID=2741433 RepID=A0A8J8KEZ5_9BACI|nr:YaaC family protein [Calidifontibacillus erzurumensis]NSL52345.1 YaaC family protein [Calidifontibacillus erzurumensis]